MYSQLSLGLLDLTTTVEGYRIRRLVLIVSGLNQTL